MSNSDNTLGPDFLCIGARKTGTTWLYAFLKRHPDCYVPRIKEMNFFNSVLFTKAPGEATAEELQRKWATIRPKKGLPEDAPVPAIWRTNPLRWYIRTYSHPKGTTSGDISPLYQDIPAGRIAGIKAAIPEAKILYILRHPLERVLSDFSMFVNNRKIDLASMSDVECFDLLRGQYGNSAQYADIYERWQAHFPVSVLFYEDLRRDPVAFSNQVCGLLNIPTMPELAEETRNPNPSQSYGPRPRLSDVVRRRLATLLLPEAEAAHRLFDNEYTATWLADMTTEVSA